jgi:hypothetical protein
MKTQQPREFIESLNCALDNIDNGSGAESTYMLEKLDSLKRWVIRYHDEVSK